MLLYLIRHGHTDWNRDRRIMGLKPMPLNDQGREAVSKLADFLGRDEIQVVYTSTIERALETARILSDAWGCEIRNEPRLNESPYERWVGKKFDELAGDPDFKLYSSNPTRSNFSDLESMADIQNRALGAVERIAEEMKTGRAAAVSHSDVIKPVITHYLGMNLDSMHRMSIANASASLLDLGYPGGTRVKYMNIMPWKW